MKIAVPTKGNLIDDHFGHCEAYTIFNINTNKEIASTEILPAPQGCGCKSNIASVLQDIGVTIMLAGNMGNGALFVLNNHGIDVYRGNSGNAEQIVKDFLNGNISDSGIGCQHHGEGHTCNH